MTAEAERSIHDALCVIRDLLEEPKVVAGGSAPEMELANVLRKYAQTLSGREQLAVKVFRRIPGIDCHNACRKRRVRRSRHLIQTTAAHEKGQTWAA